MFKTLKIAVRRLRFTFPSVGNNGYVLCMMRHWGFLLIGYKENLLAWVLF